MTDKIKNICVFASASNNIDRSYYNDAYKLGVAIAKNGFDIVFGGSNLGLMGEVTLAARINGSDVIGVMPERLYNAGIHPGECTKFILTKGMRERKAKMDELSQAIIALPGGFGTLEELSEMIVQKQLGYNSKPIVLMNTNGYYDKLVEFFNEIMKRNFATADNKDIYFVAKNANETLEYILNYKENNIDYLSEKLQKNQPLV